MICQRGWTFFRGMQMDLDVSFNEWAFMAKTDPEVFERCRERCINGFLSSSGRHRQRLQALQSRIDGQRKLANSPQEAVVAISEMMCESLRDLAHELSDLSGEMGSLGPPSTSK